MKVRQAASTLLGPEVSVAIGSRLHCGPELKGLKPGSPRYRPYVENFTVDASIFVVTTSY